MSTNKLKAKIREMEWGDKAFFLLLGTLLLVVLATFRDYGLSYDEFQHSIKNGYSILKFFTTFGKELSSLTTSNFKYYGGLFDAPAILFLMISPMNIADSHHLAIAMVGLAGLWGCRQVARKIGGPWAGFWATLFLVLCAPYYGHIFINYKDVPFATAYIWSLFAILKTTDEWPSPSRKTRLLLGFCIGAALGIRVGGVVLFLYLFMLMALDFALEAASGKNPAGAAGRLGKMALAALGPIALAYLVMIIFWPAALMNPLSLPVEAFSRFSNFDYNFLMLWDGRWYWSNDLPALYLPVLFGVESPEFLLPIGAGAIFWSARMLYAAGRERDRETLTVHSLLLAAILSLPVYAILTQKPMYDNMRHFLFVLPPLCVLSALAWERFLGILRARVKSLAHMAIVSIVIVMTAQIYRLAELHPYEYTFKNLFAGGMPEAAANYETDYWATAYREAAGLLVEHAKRVAAAEGVAFEGRTFLVAVHEVPLNVSGFLPKNFQAQFYLPPEFLSLADAEMTPTEENIASFFENGAPETDYLITRTHLNAHKMSPSWKAVATVERAGMLFAVVKANPAIAEVP